ncbi:hypothetical protein NQ318_002000 [Aromia moschata]|uniref:N-acetylglucosaminylphosphatidylinositol deacetylase n=1 Tax=Aromia moschata TaxID=1265417 RepID=A0AAV8Z4D7_9CUCU|nr:hypothetical protein NQ318_002000 [Aromia moschata]
MNRTLLAWEELSQNLALNDISEHFRFIVSSLKQYLVDTVEHLTLATALYIVICITLYYCIVKWKLFVYNRDPRNAKRILFIIAHPDDECMFFGPTILNFTKRDNCLVYLMCLSTGRNYGMGSIRKNELYNSCKVLGIKPCNIFIHNHSNLPDAMDVRWPTELLSRLISQYIDSLNITTVVTFDRYGVSNHCNHSCIYYAVASLILDRRLPRGCGVYVLETVNILRKYWLLLDIPLSFIFSRFRYMGGFEDRKILHRAMNQHKSQLVWFRRIYMYFSRYMLINSLQQMNLVDIELDLEIED